MSTIKIIHPHHLDAAQLQTELDKLNAEMKQRYNVTTNWISDTQAEISAPGVTGLVETKDQQISINIDLNMMLVMMAGPIESGIRTYLTKNIS